MNRDHPPSPRTKCKQCRVPLPDDRLTDDGRCRWCVTNAAAIKVMSKQLR